MGNLDELVPTVEDLAQWEQTNKDELGAPVELIEQYLQLAADWLVLASGIAEAPDPNTPLGRIVKAAILDMAWYLGTTKESQDEIFSPFSSEHIGSYSYNKMAKAVMQGDETGVSFFDLALKYLADSDSVAYSGGIGGGTENVFWQPQAASHVQPAYDRVDKALRLRFGVAF